MPVQTKLEETKNAQNIQIPFEKFTLPNGLTVIVHEDHKAPIVALNIWYHVGSKNEKERKTGFAHLFEHLMFGGSENLRGQYIEAMEHIGATDLNGTTSEDRTNYFENVPVSALDYALFAESDRMGHFYKTISQDVLDLQRGVVQNEKRQGDNQPYAIAEELITRATYPTHHPYAHTVIGSMEDLDAASLDDVKDWFKTYYGPSNAVLVMAGDIDIATAKEKAMKYFGDIPPGPPVAHQEVWVAKMSGEHRERVQDRVPLARLYKVWNIPQYGSAEATYLNLVSTLLTSGKSSRFYKRLVYEDQIATSVHAYVDAREIGGQFVIEATARKGVDLRDIETALDEELAHFLKDGPTASELNRAKTQHFAAFIRGIERIGGFGGKSDILARSQTFLGSPDAYQASLERLQSATADDLKDVANQWLSDGVYVLQILPFADLKAAQPIARSAMPEVGPTPDSKLPALQRATLSNGLQVILAERHEIPVINFWLAVDAGYAADASVVPGTAKLTAAVMTSGTERRTALDISDEIQSLGALLNAASTLDFTLVQLSALKANLDESLDLFADIILYPVFPEEEFHRQQKLQLATIDNEKATPVQMALRVIGPLLYGHGHAYSVPLTGSGLTETVAGLTREDLIGFHAAWFQPAHSTLVVVGDTTLAEILPKLEKHFSGWENGNRQEKVIVNVPDPSSAHVYLIDKPGSQQSVVIAGSLAPRPSAEADIAIEAANNVYGGNFGARLNMNLREEKHWTYGASAFLYGARGQRPYISYTSVQTDKTKETIQEILAELKGITGEKPVTEEELSRVKRQTILELPGSRETMTAVGSSILNLVEFDLPDNYYDTYVSKVEALTTEDLDQAARSIISPNQQVWIIVGDRAAIEDDIRSLALGPIHHIDADGKATV